jgi:hypothetical protein
MEILSYKCLMNKDDEDEAFGTMTCKESVLLGTGDTHAEILIRAGSIIKATFSTSK